MRLSESILNNLNEEDTEISKGKDINSLIETIKRIIADCNGIISFVDLYGSDDRHSNIEIAISCRFKADELSKYSNDVSLEGRLWFNNDLKLVISDLSTSSGPNVLNYDFIHCLNALYSFFKSGNQHYDF